MPLQLVRNDIAKMHVHAIVNTADSRLGISGGVCGAIHKAAGPKLLEACLKLNGCEVGAAKITQGFELPCKYVIHTVSPAWQDGLHGEAELLAACYHSALALAVHHGCKSIAFPLIASGAHGFSKARALRIATQAINSFLLNHVPDNDLMVYLVMFSRESLLAGSKLFADIRQYIDDHYVDAHFDFRMENRRANMAKRAAAKEAYPVEACAPIAVPEWNPATLEDALGMIDECFSEMVLRKIKEKGMKNSECYKKANIDKKLFSKIINTAGYKPKKTTALALAVALELSLEDTRELLMKAGLALSHSDKFDIIVEFFIRNGKYDIFEINEILYDFDLALLGGSAF